MGIGAPIADTETKKLDMQLDVNLRGVYLTARECIPMLKEAGAEHGKALMVNTASIAGKYGQGWLAAYSATKFGVVGLSQALAPELSNDGIQVTAFCPGFVDTAMTDWVEGVARDEMIQPEDIAEAVRFLLRTSPACIVPEIQFIRPGDTPYVAAQPATPAACAAVELAAGRSRSGPPARPARARTRRAPEGAQPGPARRGRGARFARWRSPVSAGAARRGGRLDGGEVDALPSRAMLASSIARSVFSSRGGGRPRAGRERRCTVPGAGEARQARAPAVAVGGEHRADAAARGRCRRRR